MELKKALKRHFALKQSHYKKFCKYIAVKGILDSEVTLENFFLSQMSILTYDLLQKALGTHLELQQALESHFALKQCHYN